MMDASDGQASLRSWLFAPGSNARIMGKAIGAGADAVILDLEDAVATSEKDSARAHVTATLAEHAGRDHLFVRVNALSTAFAFADIRAVVMPGLTGIMLPKAESPHDIAILDWLLAQGEREAGLAPGTIGIVPLIETAAGVAHALPIARASPRVRQMAFGAGDFTLEMGLHWSRDETELYPARSAIVLASRIARICQPIDAVWVEMGDREGMALSAARARSHGFQGKMCIHPDQVAAVHAAYSPTEAEVDRARRIVAAFDLAEREGKAAVQLDGKMIDIPIVEIARRTLADARRN